MMVICKSGVDSSINFITSNAKSIIIGSKRKIVTYQILLLILILKVFLNSCFMPLVPLFL